MQPSHLYSDRLEGYKPDTEGDSWTFVPDYLNDLNAMHEAEKTLDSKPIDERSMYYDFLLLVTPGWPPWLPSGEPPDSFEMDWKIVRATAAQRAEAFLRTIGKWVD